MLLVKMAFRNIFRQRRRTIFSAMAICVGYLLVSVSIGFSDGGYGRIINMITQDSFGHIQIHAKNYLDDPSIYKTIDDYFEIKKKLSSESLVKGFAPRIYTPALAFNGKKSLGLRITGIDISSEKVTSRILNKIHKGRFFDIGKQEVVVSKSVAKILNLNLNGEIVFISQGADGSIANDIFKVVGIVETENSTLEKNVVFMSIPDVQEFLSLYGKVHEVVILLKDHKQSRDMAKLLQSGIKYDVDPWQIVREDFYKAMRADQKGNYVSLVIIMLIVAVGIFNTILMTILERTREYGLFKAIGTRPWNIFKLIVFECGILGLLSVIPGILLSLIAHYFLIKYGITIDPPIEYGGVTFSSVKTIINFNVFWTPFWVVMLTSLLVSIYPAFRASRIVPSEALRDF